MKRMLWILAAMVISGALILTYYVNAQRQEVGERVITLTVTGLPSDLPKSGKIRVVKRVLFGFSLFYQPWIDLDEITGSGTYEIIVPAEFNTISIYPINLSDHIRYEPAQRSYAVKKAPPLLEINFTRQYYLDIEWWAWSKFGYHNRGLPFVEVNPQARSGWLNIGAPQPSGSWHNEGTPVSIKPEGSGLKLAWWEIALMESSTDVVNSTDNQLQSLLERKHDYRQLGTDVVYSTDNPLQLAMDGPIYVLVVLVEEWERLVSKDPEQQGIAVKGLKNGQTVRLISNGQVIAETQHWTEGKGYGYNTPAILLVPRDHTVSGYFQVTASDGVTVVFESQVYDDLTYRDLFAY